MNREVVSTNNNDHKFGQLLEQDFQSLNNI